MKIIKQLSEDEFVIKMDEYDLDKTSSIVVAHDYVQFTERMGIQAEIGIPCLTGKYASCSNWIFCRKIIQIPIRRFIKLVLPFLNKHQYCQSEHLVDCDGNPRYLTSSKDIVFFKDGKEQKVAISIEGKEDYEIISRDVYESIKQTFEK